MNVELPETRGAHSGLRWLDPVGGVVSAACAVHCLATPLLLLVAPVLVGEALEHGLAVVAIGIAAAVGLSSWRRRRGWFVPVMVVVGAVAMGARFALGESPAELALSLVGASAFVVAHFASFRALRRECCEVGPSSTVCRRD